jgi:hypothetical protein
MTRRFVHGLVNAPRPEQGSRMVAIRYSVLIKSNRNSATPGGVSMMFGLTLRT